MDWPSENTGPRELDIEKVYRYGSHETLVLRQLTTDVVSRIPWFYRRTC